MQHVDELAERRARRERAAVSGAWLGELRAVAAELTVMLGDELRACGRRQGGGEDVTGDLAELAEAARECTLLSGELGEAAEVIER